MVLGTSLDISDALLLIGIISLVGGVAALNKPAAVILFGIICLLFWARKNMRGRAKWDG